MDEDLNSYFINLEWYSNNVNIDNICNRLLNNNDNRLINNDNNDNNNQDNLKLFYYNFITFLYNKKDQYKFNSSQYIKIKNIIEKFNNKKNEFFIVQNYRDYILSNYSRNEIGALFHRLLVVDGLVNYKVDYYDYYMMINNNLDLIVSENDLANQIISGILNYLDFERNKNIQTLYLFFSVLLVRNSTSTLRSTFDLDFKNEFIDKFIKYFSSFLLYSSTTSFKNERNGINYIVLSSKMGNHMILEFEECKLLDYLNYLIKILNERNILLSSPPSSSSFSPSSSSFSSSLESASTHSSMVGKSSKLTTKSSPTLKATATATTFNSTLPTSKSDREYNVIVLGLLEVFNCIQSKFKNIIHSIIKANTQYRQIKNQSLIKEYINLLVDHGLFKYSSLCLYLEKCNIRDLLKFRESPITSIPLFKIIIIINNILSSTSSNNSCNSNHNNSTADKMIISLISKIGIEEINNIFYNSYELENNINNNKQISSETIKSLYLYSFYRIKNNYSIENSLDSLFYKIELCGHKQSFIKSILNDLVVNLDLNIIDRYIYNSMAESLINNKIYNNKKSNSNNYNNISNNSNSNNKIITKLPNYIIKYILHYLIIVTADNENSLLFRDIIHLSLVNKLFFTFVSELIGGINNSRVVTMNNRVLSKEEVNFKWSLIKVENIKYLNIRSSSSTTSTSVTEESVYYNKRLDNLVSYDSLEIIEINGSFCKSIFSNFIYLLKHPTLKSIIINCNFLDIMDCSKEFEYYQSFKQFKFKLSIERDSFAPIISNVSSIISIRIPACDFTFEYFDNEIYKVQNYIITDSIYNQDDYKVILPPNPLDQHQNQDEYQSYLERMKKFENLATLAFEGTNNDSIELFLKFISGHAVNLSEIVILPLSTSVSISTIFDFLSSDEINLPSLFKITFRTVNNYSLSFNNWESINLKSFLLKSLNYKSFYKLNNNNSNKNSDSSNGNNKYSVCDSSFKKIQFLELNSSNSGNDENLYMRQRKSKYQKTSTNSTITENISNDHEINLNYLKIIDKYDFYQHEKDTLDFYPTSFINNKLSLY